MGEHPPPADDGRVLVPEGRLSVWLVAQRTHPAQRKGRYVPEQKNHPARMYPAIAAHAITTYTQPGDLVLDPMAGIGTTLVEAMHLGRDALGVEYEPAWSDIADANIAQARSQGAPGSGGIIRGDATCLTRLIPTVLRGKVALVLTSPPYGATVHGHLTAQPGNGIIKQAATYGHDRGNLAYQSTGALLDGFTEILTGCRTLLRPGGYVVVTARPFRNNGPLMDLPSAVIAAGVAAGLEPVERCVALLAALRDGRYVARPSFYQLDHVRKAITAGRRLALIAHEDTIVLQKGGWARGSDERRP
jgi:modification methylase